MWRKTCNENFECEKVCESLAVCHLCIEKIHLLVNVRFVCVYLVVKLNHFPCTNSNSI